MKSLWNEGDRRELQERLWRLQPEAERRWGGMTAPQMLTHLSDAMRMALGELTCTPKRLPIRYPPLKQLIIYWLPFPQGAPTAPELLGRTPASWDGEVADLIQLMDRLARQPADWAAPDHPAFGTLSRRAWGVLGYRHTDHHLRQFGG
jgi:hypothetical protein